ncbi:S-adenosyl-L-methionine-dependent methyltransferase [Glonium stellatum]|uniref:S-adenosyl-L-methionine-dependent methyltransferase n=1 Tax=Glonium stellatum TaxID=574774 RepID=A0A8E2JQ95_9PEZI|nr:S-adenosyl-L-methionine-dependent methyltransferase [Glonium stellatum]
MTRPTSLTELARRILESAERIEGKVDGEVDGKHARQDLVEAVREMQLSTTGPSELLEQHQMHYQSLSCLGWLIHFNIFTHVPVDLTPIAYTDLAAAAQVPLARLQSVARMAMTSSLFAEPAPTHIAHSALSASFAADPHLRHWARFMTSYSAPTAAAFAEATARWGETTAKNETAYNVAFGTSLPFFAHVKESPGMAELFAAYMRSQGQSEGGRLTHLVDGFDWGGLDEGAQVVDVGGSTGQASIALAAAYPGLHFTVQDLPETIASAPAALSALPAPVAARLRFAAHDFFAPQPAPQSGRAPDIYLLRKILHDWPVARARDILDRLAVALRDGGNPRARLVVMDTILPPPGAVGRLQEAGLRVRDLTMAQSFNSKERELAEWEELFASAEPKLRLRAWKQPYGSTMAVMEVGLDGCD